MQRLCWAILTGEYPPQAGGVSDYTYQLAQGLFGAGDEVHVWAPPCDTAATADGGVMVHRLADHFGPKGLSALSDELKALNRPYRLLVQYTPHAYGYKAMNLFFCRWLARHDAPLWMHFHEVAYPFEKGQRLRHRLLAITTHWMAKITARAASRIFVTTPSWNPLIEHFVGPVSMTWLGACSNLPVVAQESQVRKIRSRIGQDRFIIGHFGTFGQSVTPMLEAVLPRILEKEPHCRILLVGRGSEEFSRHLLKQDSRMEGRLTATGAAAAQHAADCLAACDVLVQPYPDGVTARRGSLMAGLALGCAIVTSAGPLTEPFWRDQGAVIVADSREQMVGEATRLLSDQAARDDLGARARKVYAESFAIEHAICCLRTTAVEDLPV